MENTTTAARDPYVLPPSKRPPLRTARLSFVRAVFFEHLTDEKTVLTVEQGMHRGRRGVGAIRQFEVGLVSFLAIVAREIVPFVLEFFAPPIRKPEL